MEKKKLLIVFALMLDAGLVFAQKDDCSFRDEKAYIASLKNSDWDVRYKALRCASPGYLANPEVQQAVISIIDRELAINAQWNKDYEAGKDPAGLGEEYGFYLGLLQETLFKISDNSKTVDALLTSLTISGWSIENTLIETYGIKLLPAIYNQFANPKIRPAQKWHLFSLTKKMNKKIDFSKENKAEIRKFTLDGLDFIEGELTQERAIGLAVDMGFSDDEIINKVKRLTDSKNRILKQTVSRMLPKLMEMRSKKSLATVMVATTVVNNIVIVSSAAVDSVVPNREPEKKK